MTMEMKALRISLKRKKTRRKWGDAERCVFFFGASDTE